MAVLAQVPGLEVEVVDCYHRPFKEYEDNEDEQSPEAEGEQRTYEMTRYIESSSGAKFGIRRAFPGSFGADHGIRMDIRIDGRRAKWLIYSPAYLNEDNGSQVYSFRHEYRDSKRLRRNFQFAALETGE